MEYLNFDLEIGPGNGREYPVAVRSPAGETAGSMRFPFDATTLENRLLRLQNALLRSGGELRRRILSDEERAVQDFGQRLFEALLVGDLRSRYDVSREQAGQERKGLRLRLHIQAPELAALPWEYLYDPRHADYLCLSRHTLLVRYLGLPQLIPPLMIEPPLRILGMIANPSDQDQLNVESERERMRQALISLEGKGLVKLTWLEGQTWQDLHRAMQRGPWHIFHFIGHGGFNPRSDEGVLALANEEGKTRLLSATELGRLLTNHLSLRLAVLNACEGAKGSQQDVFSSSAAMLARRGIPAILTMQQEISDRAAIELTRTFYEALASGNPVDEAVAQARTAISIAVANSLEWGVPVLYMRSPDGVLFDVSRKSDGNEKPQPQPEQPPLASQPLETASKPERVTAASSQLPRTSAFISYSHADKKLLDQLHIHLAPYVWKQTTDFWDDTKIKPGSNWREEIEKAIKSAKVAVLLVSAEFLASEFITKNELPPLLAAAKQEGATILCVILGPCAFLHTELAQFQSVNPPSQPLAGMTKVRREALWARVAELVNEALNAQQ